MNKASRFTIAIIILAALQTLFLVSMIWGRISLLRSEHIVMLQTEPVDPRDIFRGDYVRLSYGISRLVLDGLEGDKTFEQGDKVYVEIAPISSRNTWLAVGTYKEKPVAAHGHEIIRGRIDYVQTGVPRVSPLPGGNDMLEEPCEKCVALNVNYGIESYFIPQGTGTDLEKAGNARRISVDVALGDDGEAAIKGLRLDGKALYEEPLF
jgi:uncharacterized membrane-anchored protein